MSTWSLPLSDIINVQAFISPQPAALPAFNQGLIVGVSTVIPSVGANSRLRQYTSLSGMTGDGFTTTNAEYLAAELYFGQIPQPQYVWIGRRDLTAIQTVTVGASGGTGYLVGDVVTVTQSLASGGQLQVATITTGGVVTGVTIIPAAQGTGYTIASNLPVTGGNGTGLEINVTAVGETWAQAVNACRVASPQWYVVTPAAVSPNVPTDADLLAVAAEVQGFTPPSVYFLTTGDANVLNNITGNLLAELQAAQYTRTLSVYSTTQGGAYPNNAFASAGVMGLAMALNTGAAASYFDLNNKTVSGVAFEPLTQSQANNILGTVTRTSVGLNGNAVLNYQNSSYIVFQFGNMASGLPFDIVMNVDMLVADIQVSAMNLLVSVPALPITDSGITQMRNVVAGACTRAQVRGFIAPSGTWQGSQIGNGPMALFPGDPVTQGFYVYAPAASTLTAGQRASRQLPTMTVALIESESGRSLTVEVLMQQ
jgi:hypothetical protein